MPRRLAELTRSCLVRRSRQGWCTVGSTAPVHGQNLCMVARFRTPFSPRSQAATRRVLADTASMSTCSRSRCSGMSGHDVPSNSMWLVSHATLHVYRCLRSCWADLRCRSIEVFVPHLRNSAEGFALSSVCQGVASWNNDVLCKLLEQHREVVSA